MFEAPIPRLETRDFTIGIAAVDDLGAGAEKLRQSVAEKSLSARAHAKRSDLIGARDEGLRRTTRLLACSLDDRGCAGGERMHFLKRHDRVAVMVRASDQRMFRRKPAPDFDPGWGPVRRQEHAPLSSDSNCGRRFLPMRTGNWKRRALPK